MLFITILTILLPALANAAITYESILSALTLGMNDEPLGGNGTISVSIKLTDKRNGRELMPDLNFTTNDNYEILSPVSGALKAAGENGFLGDQIYLYHVVKYNGIAEYVALTNDSDFTMDLCEYFEGDAQEAFDKWANTSTHSDLKNYFKTVNCNSYN